eukprot:TRINITY_DN7353_c0_g1_i6.p2 TRINITY_DN7353_c0_g1~~TRINITY_DN7353_c0_g1_i6.p2  ORF type:complete len:125 (+),score=36.11 TRINITY_DN7353_c0_g1_i6:323-697(+)
MQHPGTLGMNPATGASAPTTVMASSAAMNLGGYPNSTNTTNTMAPGITTASHLSSATPATVSSSVAQMPGLQHPMGPQQNRKYVIQQTHAGTLGTGPMGVNPGSNTAIAQQYQTQVMNSNPPPK